MMKSNSNRPCLLVVDDTPANIQILVDLLKSDYELKVATRGAQALQICEKTPHLDLVLLDVMMPEMDGYEVCQKLRANPATHALPIIFLTARTEVDDVVRGFEIGANDYVTKPFRPPELLARVRTHLTVRAQQREIAEKNTEMKEMLHIVCHDVANHFAVLNLTFEMLAARPGLSVDRFMPQLTAAVRNGIGLTSLVRDLRRSEEKGLTLQPVLLPAAVNEALLLAEGKIGAKQLTVNQQVPELRVVAEACSLTNSVVGNVLSNAIKFSKPGGAIDLSAREEGGMVCLSLRDHGIGMPPQILDHLFDVTKSTSRKGTAGEKGTGFGMPLMRKFVVLFGGRIEVVSREAATHPDDHGTEFKIWLRQAGESGAV
ncbi:MAG: hybrid sensor histidine kinase/response regulator [Verrucomicrobia bacterium]|nr:hybrid sensor histidine kinase/response regulator [Verrucomicrobiota bacterium]